MIFAIIAIVMLVAGVYSYFLIKKERKRQVKRRAIKVKIAEGDFDNVPEEPLKKKKPKKRIIPKNSKGEPLFLVPEYVLADLAKGLPELIQRAIEDGAVLHKQAQAMNDAVSKLRRTRVKWESSTLPVEASAAQQTAWRESDCGTILLIEQQTLARQKACSECSQAISRLRGTIDQITKALKSVDFYDQFNITEEVADLMEIARILQTELPLNAYKVEGEYLQVDAALDPRRQSKDLLALDLIEIFEKELDRHFALASKVTHSSTQLQEALAEFKLEVGAFGLLEPEKPTDQDVQQFLAKGENWSDKVQKARDLLVKRLGETAEVMRLSDEMLAATKIAYDEAHHIALDEGRYLASPALQACNRAYAAILAQDTQFKATFQTAQAALLTDHTVLCQEGRFLPSEDDSSETVADVEKVLLTNLRAALRKLGFAVAQKRAAEVKLHAAKAQPTAPLSQGEPSLEEANGENFVRRYNQWLKAAEDQKVAIEAAKVRVTALEEQVKQRVEQVPQAALAVHEALQDLRSRKISDGRPGGQLSHELSVLARVADKLNSLYKA